jgi:hypothetical protein
VNTLAWAAEQPQTVRVKTANEVNPPGTESKLGAGRGVAPWLSDNQILYHPSSFARLNSMRTVIQRHPEVEGA